MSSVVVDGQALEYQLIAAQRSDRPTLVLLHEGLGSVALWRDFSGPTGTGDFLPDADLVSPRAR